MRRGFSQSKKITGKGLTAIGALLLLSAGAEASTQEQSTRRYSFKIMGFNIWNNGTDSKIWDPEELKKGNLVYNKTMQDLLRGAAPDVLVMPELYNNSGKTLEEQSVVGAHVRNTLGVLNSLPDTFGTYQKNPDYDTREGSGMVFASGNVQSLGPNTLRINPDNGFSELYFEGLHLNYYDEPKNRIAEVKALNSAALERDLPTILAGDFNAGDISERGLHRAEQQAALYARYIMDDNASDLWQQLAQEYVPPGRESDFQHYLDDMRSTDSNGIVKYRNVLSDYFDTHREEFPGMTDISDMSWRQWEEILAKDMEAKGLTFVDEIYPVDGNQPVTMNILKQHYQLMQLERNREQFTPSRVGDRRATWTSDGEDATNIWESWDRVNIDHIMVSRPFAKWVEIVDNGQWSGTLSEAARLPDGGSLSDHDPVTQQLRWTGPQLETYGEGLAEKTRLVWGAGAYYFEGKNKTFYLTRNNNRNDVYLGQISDAEGNPTLSQLTPEQKKTLLDCKSIDPALQKAIKDYCIDDHSFIGETLVTDGGTLQVDEDAALGGTDARLRLADGGLQVLGNGLKTLDRKISLEGPGWLDVAEATNSVLLQQEVSGFGSLIKRGAGTAVLGETNSYTGGTYIEGGTLRAGKSGAFVDDTAFDIREGLLDLNGFDLKMSSLSGLGGNLDLGGATLEIAQNSNTRYNGSIYGEGNLVKSGSGFLILNGDNTHIEETTVNVGGLIIGDDEHPDASLGGNLNLEANTYLGGSGRVGTLDAASGSSVAPGDSIGTLTVLGDLTLDAGSTYLADIAPDGTSDKIVVEGAANLGGAQLQLVKAPGFYDPGSRYTLLSAEGGITGTFRITTQKMPFVDLNLNYDPTTVYLDITRNNVQFAETAKTDNQRAVASHLDKLGSPVEVYNAVARLEDEESARRAFDALSGEFYASVQTALINESEIIRNVAYDRLHSVPGSALAGQKEAAEIYSDQASGVWIQTVGSWGKARSDGNAATMKQSSGGLLLGYDIPMSIGRNARLGVLAGYRQSSINVDARSSSALSDNYHVGAYGGAQWDVISLKTGLAYSWHELDANRTSVFPGFEEKLSSRYGAQSFQAFGELSHQFDLQALALEPFTALALARLATDEFREKGGNAALSGKGEAMTTTFGTLGTRASIPLVLGSANLRLSGLIGWQHATGDTRSVSTVAFSDGVGFDVVGTPIARDTTLMNIGVDATLNKMTALNFHYVGQFGDGFSENGVQAKLSFRF